MSRIRVFRKKSFRFLDLPLEVRPIMYELLLTPPNKQIRNPHRSKPSNPHPQILRMSPQIREEASFILYGSSSFHFDTFRSSLSFVEALTRDNARQI